MGARVLAAAPLRKTDELLRKTDEQISIRRPAVQRRPAMGRIVLGVDSSTQSTKVLAVDVESGQVMARAQARHVVSDGLWRETDPEVWWRALGEALGGLGEYAGRAEAVSVGGQQHELVVLDEAGAPLRPAPLWNDVRSAPQAAALVAERGEGWWADRFGSVPGASFTVTKWLWLRENEPETAKA